MSPFGRTLRSVILCRTGSGGEGAFRGGQGVVRELEFRKPLVVSILSERRALRPFGLAGGMPGARGCNTLLRCAPAAGARPLAVFLGGKSSVSVAPGERLRIETPGGGGYGPPSGMAADAAAARLLQEAEAQRDEYNRAVAAAVAASSAPTSTGAAPTSAPVAEVADLSASSSWSFSGSLGAYKEAQESA
jgi:N-methylhydantoinase B/oxoprolinase/acetone carboxylase alpha subunit